MGSDFLTCSLKSFQALILKGFHRSNQRNRFAQTCKPLYSNAFKYIGLESKTMKLSFLTLMTEVRANHVCDLDSEKVSACEGHHDIWRLAGVASAMRRGIAVTSQCHHDIWRLAGVASLFCGLHPSRNPASHHDIWRLAGVARWCDPH